MLKVYRFEPKKVMNSIYKFLVIHKADWTYWSPKEHKPSIQNRPFIWKGSILWTKYSNKQMHLIYTAERWLEYGEQHLISYLEVIW